MAVVNCALSRKVCLRGKNLPVYQLAKEVFAFGLPQGRCKLYIEKFAIPFFYIDGHRCEGEIFHGI